ncbi:MAG: hypothetical protein M3256_02425 [Actinomycetota bacterium]|nr:hypothetical protein [Actinomycetota bacterium]
MVCLFSDWRLLPPDKRILPRGLARWWWPQTEPSQLEPPEPERMVAVQEAANTYSVPLVSVADSIRLGVLNEFGVGQREVADLQGWLASKSPAPRDARRPHEA